MNEDNFSQYSSILGLIRKVLDLFDRFFVLIKEIIFILKLNLLILAALVGYMIGNILLPIFPDLPDNLIKILTAALAVIITAFLSRFGTLGADYFIKNTLKIKNLKEELNKNEWGRRGRE